MNDDQTRPTVIVVGVQHEQVCAVVEVAAQFAQRFGAALVCVTVDSSLLSAGTRSDGSAIVEAIDPDTAGRGDTKPAAWVWRTSVKQRGQVGTTPT